MTRIATLCAIAASVSLSAQTAGPTHQPAAPAPGASVSVTGCVAQAQRDGSLGAKPTATEATPQTAADEANNPNPTGRYQLVDATPVGADQKPADASAPGAAGQSVKAAKTTYGLRGHEQELAKHLGHRVEIAGTLAASPAAKLPSKTAATAEGTRALQVASIKMIGTNCSVSEGK